MNWKWWFGTAKEHAHRACFNRTIKFITTRKIQEVGAAGAPGAEGVKHNPLAFWIHKIDGQVVFHYKEYASDELWLPFLRDAHGELATPRATDPKGIPLFTCDPEGGLSALQEAALRTTEGARESAKASAVSEDESEDEGGGKGLPKAQTEAADGETSSNKTTIFSPSAVVEAVHQLQHDATAVNLGGASLFTEEQLQDWSKWADQYPITLAAIPKDERQRPYKFPPCDAHESSSASARAAREQIELIVWQEGDDTMPHRGVDAKKNERELRERRAVRLDEMEVGVACVIHPRGGVQTDGGHESRATSATPFWVADVRAKIAEHTNDAGEVGPAVKVHWRAPFFNGLPSSDPNAKWVLLCKCQHEYTARCAVGTCSGGRRGGAWEDTIMLNTVVLTKLKINQDQHLHANGMKDIAKLGIDLGVDISRVEILKSSKSKGYKLEVRPVESKQLSGSSTG